jgi:hypothetical protein
MTLKFSLPLIILTFFLSCCTKKKSIDQNKLYGKWMLIEVLDPYGAGGNQDWQKVTKDSSYYLKFLENGEYFKIQVLSVINQDCIGKFRMPNLNKIEINSNCSNEIETMQITQLTENILVTDVLGTEGIIRNKYISTKE